MGTAERCPRRAGSASALHRSPVREVRQPPLRPREVRTHRLACRRRGPGSHEDGSSRGPWLMEPIRRRWYTGPARLQDPLGGLAHGRRPTCYARRRLLRGRHECERRVRSSIAGRWRPAWKASSGRFPKHANHERHALRRSVGRTVCPSVKLPRTPPEEGLLRMSRRRPPSAACSVSAASYASTETGAEGPTGFNRGHTPRLRA